MCSVLAGNATACIFTGDVTAALRWPLVAQSPVDIGGITVSCSTALAACEILRTSQASAIASVLRAAGSPLADCDYHAVYRPGLAAARAELAPAPGMRGPRGRHLAKRAFEHAVRGKVAETACRLLEDIIQSFRADERYASAIASDAVAMLSRQGHRRGSAVIRDTDSCSSEDDIAA